MPSLFDQYCLPYLIDKSCAHKLVAAERQTLVPMAEGDVLEVGMGTGLNLPYYDWSKVKHLWGLEPADAMRSRAEPRMRAAPIDVEWLDLPGEEIPLPDQSVDTVVMTYTLCSITDTAAALMQIRRVLRPGGRLLFSEHGASPDAAVRRWQNRLNPLWGVIGGGCNLNRPIDTLIEQAGFAFDDLDKRYLDPDARLLKFADFNYRGVAAPI